MINEKLIKEVEKLSDEMRTHRRWLHEHPEVSGKEFQTSMYLKEYVKQLGLKIVEVGTTSFYTILDSGKAGKTIGIRCDMDALPMMEADTNLKRKRNCKSKIDGVMHACGHDAHMTINLGVMKILFDHKENWKGKVIFIFEEGEEQGLGIDAMLIALKDISFDVIYGTHVTSFMDVGSICVDEGARMAGMYFVELDVIGRGGHGSRPDLAINPIFAAAHILTNLSTVWTNQLDVTKTVTLGISQIHAGTANNIIPDVCTIGGSIRFFDQVEGNKARDLVYKVAQDTASIHGCTIKKGKEVKTVPVINDKEYSRLARTSIEEIFPQAIEEDVVWFASESFARYRELAPTIFMFSGVRNEELGSGADHHNQYFDLDEDVLNNSILAQTKIALDILK